MASPLRVLDVVELVDPEGDGPAPETAMVVTEVRRYPDGTHRYSVAAPGDENWVSTIYRQDQLRPTGTRVAAGAFALPGPFSYRDIVRVSADYPDRELAGQEGYVDGWQGGETPVSIWFEGLAEGAFLEVSALSPTGRRAPAPAAVPYPVHQAREHGERSGPQAALAYTVLDELDVHL